MGGIEQLVGRQDTLRRLRAVLDDALGGRGRVVLIAGEPGIGKTAVMGALADEAAVMSAVVAWGQCWDDSMAPAFWPWTQVLRELATAPGQGSVGELLTDPDRRATADRSGDRFELFDGVRTKLIEASESHGLVVVLDDLHWADGATMALLSFLSRHVRRARVLIVGAFRDVDATPPLAELMGRVDVVTLEGLAERDAVDLADAVAAGRLASDGVADVVRRAGGNPLFVRELTFLRAAGRASGEPVPVPGGVREVVAQRLARLSPACRTMLDVAAVLGAEVRLDVLARTLGGRDDLPSLIAEAVRARILVTPPDELTPLGFVHDLFREVLCAMLSPAVKAQLHLTSPAPSMSFVPTAPRTPTPPWPRTMSPPRRWACGQPRSTPFGTLSARPARRPVNWPSTTPPGTCVGRSPHCSLPIAPRRASGSTCCCRWLPRSTRPAMRPQPAAHSSRRPNWPARSATPTASPGPPSASIGWVR